MISFRRRVLIPFRLSGPSGAARRGWLELCCVAQSAAVCPCRPCIHYEVFWQGSGCVRRNTHAHGTTSLCTLQTLRSHCAYPDSNLARLSGERPPSLLGGGGPQPPGGRQAVRRLQRHQKVRCWLLGLKPISLPRARPCSERACLKPLHPHCVGCCGSQ